MIDQTCGVNESKKKCNDSNNTIEDPSKIIHWIRLPGEEYTGMDVPRDTRHDHEASAEHAILVH